MGKAKVVRWLEFYKYLKNTSFKRWNFTPSDEWSVLHIFSQFFNAYDRNYYVLMSAMFNSSCGSQTVKNARPRMESLVTACAAYHMDQNWGFYSLNSMNLGGEPRAHVIWWMDKLHKFYGTKPTRGPEKMIKHVLKDHPELIDEVTKLYYTYPTINVPRKKLAGILRLHYPDKFGDKQLRDALLFTDGGKWTFYTTKAKLQKYREKHPEKFDGINN